MASRHSPETNIESRPAGTRQGGLDVRVENNLLTIRGQAAHIAPGDPVYREYGLVNFFRQSELSNILSRSSVRNRATILPSRLQL
jgi:hypothetical protein